MSDEGRYSCEVEGGWELESEHAEEQAKGEARYDLREMPRPVARGPRCPPDCPVCAFVLREMRRYRRRGDER